MSCCISVSSILHFRTYFPTRCIYQLGYFGFTCRNVRNMWLVILLQMTCLFEIHPCSHVLSTLCMILGHFIILHVSHTYACISNVIHLILHAYHMNDQHFNGTFKKYMHFNKMGVFHVQYAYHGFLYHSISFIFITIYVHFILMHHLGVEDSLILPA